MRIMEKFSWCISVQTIRVGDTNRKDNLFGSVIATELADTSWTQAQWEWGCPEGKAEHSPFHTHVTSLCFSSGAALRGVRNSSWIWLMEEAEEWTKTCMFMVQPWTKEQNRKNDNYHLKSTCYVPDSIVIILHLLIHLAFLTTLWSRKFYYPYYLDEETEYEVISPGSLNQAVEEAEIETQVHALNLYILSVESWVVVREGAGKLRKGISVRELDT